MIWIVAVALLGILACFALVFLIREHARTEPVWSALEAGSVRHASTRRLREASGNEPLVQETEEEETRGVGSGKDPWRDRNYCWVVVCKNRRFHHHSNPFHVHRIPLGETDSVELRPRIQRPFLVRCDECGSEYAHKPSEVLRYETDVPSSFAPHPLFRS